MAQDVDLAAALSALLAALGVASSDEAILEYATGVLSTMVEDEGDDDLQENLEHLDLLLVGACGDSYESVPEGERHLQLAEIVQEGLAAWLLDASPSDLQEATEQWDELRDREAAEAEQARLLKEHNKKQILKQFDLRPVTAPKDPRKVAKGVSAPDAFIGKEAEAQKKVRYLDGRVVSNKGEKFIIEKKADGRTALALAAASVSWPAGAERDINDDGLKLRFAEGLDNSARISSGLGADKPLCVTIRSFPGDSSLAAAQLQTASGLHRFTAEECQRVQPLLVAELTSAAESWGIQVTRAFRPVTCTGVAISVCGAVSDMSSMRALGSRMQDTSPRYFRALFGVKPFVTECPKHYRDARLALEVLAARGSADECLVVLVSGGDASDKASAAAVYEGAAHVANGGGRRLRALFWPFSSAGARNHQQCERKAYSTPFVMNPLSDCSRADALDTMELVADKALGSRLLAAKLRSMPVRADDASSSPLVAIEKDLTTEWVARLADADVVEVQQQGHLLRISGLRLRSTHDASTTTTRHQVCLELASGATLADLCGGGSCVMALRDPRGKCCPSYTAAAAGPGQRVVGTAGSSTGQQAQQQKQHEAGGRRMARSATEKL
eukprot:XP_001702369.1 predicted protein [Chlamydomonas reinhardtii]